jgi:hypothetical protein
LSPVLRLLLLLPEREQSEVSRKGQSRVAKPGAGRPFMLG